MVKHARRQCMPRCVEDRWQSLQNDSQRNAKEEAKRACDLAHPAGQTREL
jgi:succinylglutamate desuccinylase